MFRLTLFAVMGLLGGDGALYASSTESDLIDDRVGILCLGVIGTLTAVYTYLWWQRRQEQASLYLALASAAGFLRILATLPSLSNSSDPLVRSFLHSIEYSTISLATIAFSFFLFRVLEIPHWIWFKRLHFSLGALLSLLPCVTPYLFYKEWLWLFQLYLVFCHAMFVALIWQARLSGKAGATPVLLGFILLFSTLVSDIFLSNRLGLVSLSLAPIGIACFLLVQGLWLVQLTARALTQSEILAHKLEDQEKARTMFFNNTSHELRTPLNGIIGFLELIVRDHYAPLSENLRPPVKQALELAEGLKSQVNTILELARMRAGRSTLHTHVFRLKSLQHSIETLSAALLAHYPQSIFTSEYNFGETEPFYGDQEKILTIVRNLIGNAFKFASPDRPNHISLRIESNADELIIRVKDTGEGIEPKYQDKIFEEFYQIQGDERRGHEGTGLGLTLVRNLLEVLQGRWTLDSSPGNGTCFTVHIPNRKEHDALNEDIATPEGEPPLLNLKSLSFTPAEKTDEDSELWKILLVDDHLANLQLLTDVLRGDYEVLTAASGTLALEKMQSWLPDLVLLDMMMPQMSGEDVLHAMKKDHRLQHIPIILITAQASDEDRLYALRLGADDYLAKPILIDELRLRVRNLLLRQEGLRERERLEINDKMVQLGTLFSDLSHEMKNMLHGASTIKAIEKQDAQIALAPISLPAELKDLLSESLQSRSQNAQIGQRIQIMGPMMQDDYVRVRQQIQGLLASSALSDSDLLAIWSEVQLLDADELVFFENQLRLLSGFHTLIGLTEHARHLAMSVLSYARSGQNSEGHAELQQVWSDFTTLIQARSRQVGIRWQVTISPVELSIATGSLLQIFMNLSMNAMDAIQTLPESERWIAVHMRVEDNQCSLIFSNGGPPIPPQTRSHLFTRGFTTKGEAGSGLGLAVSRRLAHQASGDLCYSNEAQHPSFILTLPVINKIARVA